MSSSCVFFVFSKQTHTSISTYECDCEFCWGSVSIWNSPLCVRTCVYVCVFICLCIRAAAEGKRRKKNLKLYLIRQA